MGIKLTGAAAKHIQKSLTERGSGIGIRLGVRTSGCSGMAYALEFVDQMDIDDVIFEDQNVKVIVNSKSLIYLDGCELDFVKDGLNEGFKFNNPNAKHQCGCGQSFGIN